MATDPDVIANPNADGAVLAIVVGDPGNIDHLEEEQELDFDGLVSEESHEETGKLQPNAQESDPSKRMTEKETSSSAEENAKRPTQGGKPRYS